MVEITLNPSPILGGVDIAIGSNRIVERSDLAIVSVAPPLGGDDALTEALQNGWSLNRPAPTRSTVNGSTRAIWTAADQLFLMFPSDGPNANDMVQSKLKKAGYTTDQSDAWIVFEASGPDTLAALERICPLDLHITHFPVDAAARTIMEHMGTLIVRLEPERFLLLSAGSSAGSFLHAVETSYQYVVD